MFCSNICPVFFSALLPYILDFLQQFTPVKVCLQKLRFTKAFLIFQHTEEYSAVLSCSCPKLLTSPHLFHNVETRNHWHEVQMLNIMLRRHLGRVREVTMQGMQQQHEYRMLFAFNAFQLLTTLNVLYSKKNLQWEHEPDEYHC